MAQDSAFRADGRLPLHTNLVVLSLEGIYGVCGDGNQDSGRSELFHCDSGCSLDNIHKCVRDFAPEGYPEIAEEAVRQLPGSGLDDFGVEASQALGSYGRGRLTILRMQSAPDCICRHVDLEFAKMAVASEDEISVYRTVFTQSEFQLTDRFNAVWLQS